MKNLFSIIVFVLFLSACSQQQEDSEIKECLGVDCTGYRYSPGGEPGSRLGEYGNFGSRRNVNNRDAWAAEFTSANHGCLVFGPYLPVPDIAQAFVRARVKLTGLHCNKNNLGCGNDFWSGYGGQRYAKSNWGGYSKPATFNVDMVIQRGNGPVGGHVLWSEIFNVKQIAEFDIETPAKELQAGDTNLEVRVCGFSPGQHVEFVRERCSRDICTDVTEKVTDKFVVGIHEIIIRSSFDQRQ